jgi:hypothetical protein
LYRRIPLEFYEIMSWDPTCKDIVTNNSAFEALCIASLDGNLYGTSHRDSFMAKPHEIKEAVAVAKGGQSGRVTVHDVGYIVIRRLENQAIAKKDKNSVLVGVTPKLVIMALCDESNGSKSGLGLDQLFKLQEHYTKSGY